MNTGPRGVTLGGMMLPPPPAATVARFYTPAPLSAHPLALRPRDARRMAAMLASLRPGVFA